MNIRAGCLTSLPIGSCLLPSHHLSAGVRRYMQRMEGPGVIHKHFCKAFACHPVRTLEPSNDLDGTQLEALV